MIEVNTLRCFIFTHDKKDTVIKFFDKYDDGPVDEIIEMYKEQGYTYEVWEVKRPDPSDHNYHDKLKVFLERVANKFYYM